MPIVTPTPVPTLGTTLPDPSDRTTYGTRGRAVWDWEVNELVPGINQLASDTYNNASEASDSALVAVAAANFKGAWSSLSGSLAVPAAVWHSGRVWALLVNLADVTLSEPGVSANWVDVGGVKRSGDTMTGHLNAISGATGTQVPQAQETAMLGSTQLAYRNKVVNGNFDINQDGVSGTVTLAAGVYGHDQWKAGASGCTYTFAKSAGITTVTITAGSLIQPLDGANLKSGTHVLSWTGTAQGKIGAGSYGASGQTYTVTGGTNLNIEFGTGTLSLVQFEVGSRKTLFEHMSEAQQFMRCAEFYFKGIAYWSGYSTNSGRAGAQIKFPTRMRASPTIGGQSALVASGFPSSSFSSFGVTQDGFTADLIANSTTADGRWSQSFFANARLP